jgi:HEAT repeat protein
LQKEAVRAIRTLFAVSLAIQVGQPVAGGTVVISLPRHFQQQSNRAGDAQVAEQKARLSSSNVEDRFDAVLKLAALGTPAAISALSTALEDSDENVRAIAIDGLAGTGDPQYVPVIAARLGRDKSIFVRKTAAYALGRIGSDAGTGALLRALKDKNDEMRGAASVALTKYSDPSAVDGLIAALSDKSDFVRAHAAQALGVNRRAALRAVPILIKLLDSDTALDVRRQSATALGEIGDPAALESLERARLSADPYLSHAASSAIEKIKKQGSGVSRASR